MKRKGREAARNALIIAKQLFLKFKQLKFREIQIQKKSQKKKCFVKIFPNPITELALFIRTTTKLT
jgi:hypothetical protein